MFCINPMLFSSCEEEQELYCSSTNLRSGMGHLLFLRAVSVQMHSLQRKIYAFELLLSSASLPFQSFGFLSTRLVLVNVLTLCFLPSSSYS